MSNTKKIHVTSDELTRQGYGEGTSIAVSQNTVGHGLPSFAGRAQGDSHLNLDDGITYTLTGTPGGQVTDNFEYPGGYGLAGQITPQGQTWSTPGGVATVDLTEGAGYGTNFSNQQDGVAQLTLGDTTNGFQMVAHVRALVNGARFSMGVGDYFDPNVTSADWEQNYFDGGGTTALYSRGQMVAYPEGNNSQPGTCFSYENFTELTLTMTASGLLSYTSKASGSVITLATYQMDSTHINGLSQDMFFLVSNAAIDYFSAVCIGTLAWTPDSGDGPTNPAQAIYVKDTNSVVYAVTVGTDGTLHATPV